MLPIRLGVIGCGLATKNLHWPALRRMPDKFQIVAACNRTPEKVREFAQMVEIEQTALEPAEIEPVEIETDYRRLLDDSEIDAVNEWLAFYEAVRHGKSFPSTAEQCFTDQQIVWAMLDSAAHREVVNLK